MREFNKTVHMKYTNTIDKTIFTIECNFFILKTKPGISPLSPETRVIKGIQAPPVGLIKNPMPSPRAPTINPPIGPVKIPASIFIDVINEILFDTVTLNEKVFNAIDIAVNIAI